MKSQVLHHLGEGGPHATQQNRYPLCLHLDDEVLEPFHADNVRIARPLDPQHNDAQIRTLAEAVEVAVQLRRGAEEKFALQVQEHHPRATRVGGLAVADDAVRADRQLGGLSSGRRGERTSESTGRRRSGSKTRLQSARPIRPWPGPTRHRSGWPARRGGSAADRSNLRRSPGGCPPRPPWE